jgi:dynein heavy chain
LPILSRLKNCSPKSNWKGNSTNINLSSAKPALAEATNALNSIQPAHIATVRKLAKPPHLIMRIMDGVLLLQKRKIEPCTQDPEKPCPKPSWPDSMKLMSSPDFLSSLVNFGKDEINEETVELLEPLIEMPDFNLEGAKKVSGDVAGLASWVRAMVSYYAINKMVVPLKANLIIQEHKLDLAMNDLNMAQATLDDKQAELDKFQEKYNDAIGTKKMLQDDADSCKRKMSAATALISGLKGEKERWTRQSKEYSDQVGRLVGDVILASAFLSYSGPFNQAYRASMLSDWRKELVCTWVLTFSRPRGRFLILKTSISTVFWWITLLSMSGTFKDCRRMTYPLKTVSWLRRDLVIHS